MKKTIVYYPPVRHPLYYEKDKLKRKYIALIRKYANNYEDKKFKKITDVKLQTLCKAMYEAPKDQYKCEEYTKDLEEKVFSHLSYGYVFVFDCLLLYAADEKYKGWALCTEIKTHIHKKYHKKIDEMFELMYAGDSSFADKTLITNDMVSAWNDVMHYNASTKRKIVFTATMSAGKSTLINAIVGNNISAVKNKACTSKVIKIRSTPIKNNIYTVMGDNIGCFASEMKEIQNIVQTDDKPFKIYGFFYSLLGREKLTLVDTPGVDAALHPEHKKATRALLEHNIETLVYVIPVATYGSESDDKHLKYVLRNVSCDKIIFVVNMMDKIDTEDDSVDKILKDIKEYLEKVGFKEPNVYPVSAKAGLQLKQTLAGICMSEYEKKSAKYFKEKFLTPEYDFGKYYPQISDAEKNSLNQKIYSEYDEHLWRAYINTGLPGLEKVLYNFH